MIKRIIRTAVLLAVFVLAAGISGYITLTLIIKSEDTVIIPDLSGKEIVYALEVLSDLELNTKVKGTEFDPQIPKNHVIYQSPSPGSEIKKGRDVKIVLSKGPKSVQMPNLKGVLRQQARIILEENDLCQGHLSYTRSGNYQKDEIIGQYPQPGMQMIRGECADLLISIGPPPQIFKMPDFRGFPLEEALQSIETRHLFTGEVKSALDNAQPDNIVLDQNPKSGFRVEGGTLVSLTVNRNGKEDTIKDISGSTLFRYRVERGFLNQEVRVRWNRSGFAVDLFDDLMKPGEELWLLIPKAPSSSLFLYVDEILTETQAMD